MWNVDWSGLWVPNVGLLEIFIRGSVVYLALFLYLRCLRREAGSLGTADVLFIVLLADAVQNAMGNDYHSLTEGIFLVATLAFWDVTVNWLSYQFPAMDKLLQPAPLLIIDEGKLLARNMRKEFLTKEELLSQLRKKGVSSITHVRKCYLEPDGEFSVLLKDARGK